MYTACMFCHTPLGANEVVEHFPVGRRLVFDEARGRLWVVCRKCAQWNLTPLEERWEAIEECAKLFESTKLRVSTDQVGMARVQEGLELVRIGRPHRPEFAAWRYGDQLGRRRRRMLIQSGLGLGLFGAVVIGGATAGVAIGSFGYLLVNVGQMIVKGRPDAVMTKVQVPGSGLITVKRKHLEHMQLLGGSGSEWELGLLHKKRIVRLSGQSALSTAGKLLPQLNRFGGKADRVQQAVRLLEEEVDPLRYFNRAALEAERLKKKGHPVISALPEQARLALEMAAHEESERRALEGELMALEDAWREAEEIASIADNMFLPASFEGFLKRHRKPPRTPMGTDTDDEPG